VLINHRRLDCDFEEQIEKNGDLQSVFNSVVDGTAPTLDQRDVDVCMVVLEMAFINRAKLASVQKDVLSDCKKKGLAFDQQHLIDVNRDLEYSIGLLGKMKSSLNCQMMKAFMEGASGADSDGDGEGEMDSEDDEENDDPPVFDVDVNVIPP